MAASPQSSSIITVIPMIGQKWETARGYLQQTLTSMQMALNNLIGAQGLDQLQSDWTDVPFNAGSFTANNAGSVTANQAPPYSICFKIIGPVMFINAAYNVTVNNASTNEIRMAVPLPSGYTMRTLPSVGIVDENRHRTGGVYNGIAGPAGIAGAFIDIAGAYISLQRWDGNAAANFPTGTVFAGFMVTVPVVNNNTSVVL